MPKKKGGGLGQFTNLRGGGLGKKEGDGVFEGGGRLIPHCTLYFALSIWILFMSLTQSVNGAQVLNITPLFLSSNRPS